jgi:hypothetical protein
MLGTVDADTITPEEALLAINDHLGEVVHVELYAEHGPAPHSLLEINGELSRVHTIEGAAMGDAAERDYMAGAYMIGVHSVHLGFLAAEITWSAFGGIEFHLAGGLVLALGWGD